MEWKKEVRFWRGRSDSELYSASGRGLSHDSGYLTMMSANWRAVGGLAAPSPHGRTVNTLMLAASQDGTVPGPAVLIHLGPQAGPSEPVLPEPAGIFPCGTEASCRWSYRDGADVGPDVSEKTHQGQTRFTSRI